MPVVPMNICGYSGPPMPCVWILSEPHSSHAGNLVVIRYHQGINPYSSSQWVILKRSLRSVRFPAGSSKSSPTSPLSVPSSLPFPLMKVHKLSHLRQPPYPRKTGLWTTTIIGEVSCSGDSIPVMHATVTLKRTDNMISLFHGTANFPQK